MAFNRKIKISALMVLVLGILLAVTAASVAQSDDNMEVLRLEVAGDVTTMVQQPQPVNVDGLPLHGNPFLIIGYIYPEGTLNGSDGVLADGGPEFPELVIGKWICSGWMYGDALGPTGPYAVTTQLFELIAVPGEQSIITYGFELNDLNIPLQRAIIGGTGDYVGSLGQQIQTLIGSNPTGGPNLVVEFHFGTPE